MTRARAGAILAVAGAVGAGIWWLCWVPYQPERMLHVIPRGAVVVSVHRDLAGRQDALLANPLTQFLLAATAEPDADPGVLAADPAFQDHLRRFGSGELVAAFVPAFGPLAMDSYVFSAWMGGRSHWLRWAMLLGASDMRRESQPGGRVYWITETDLKDAQGRTLQFSLALEEGLAIGCLSVDPHNLRMVFGCHDRNLPSILTTEPRLTDWLMRAEPADRGWVGAPGLLPFRYTVTALEPDRFSAQAHCEGDWSLRDPASPLTLPDLFGSLPFASGMISRGLLADVASDAAWSGDVLTLMNELDAESVGAGVFAGEYGGRLRGIRTPALVLAMPCSEGPVATALMHRIIHRLGLREGLDLAVDPTPDEDPRTYSIRTLDESFYGNLPAGERAAFCVVDGWLLAASNQLTLQRLLERREWAPGTASGPGGAVDTALWFNLDPARGEKPLRSALAVYSLVRMLDGSRSEAARTRLTWARNLVDNLADVGRIHVRAQPTHRQLVLDLEVSR